jgi:hypothetical protein
MRGLGLIGLVLALVIVGLVAKKQMASVAAPTLPAPAGMSGGDASAGNVRDQSQRVQQQVRDALDAAAKTRQMPDDN